MIRTIQVRAAIARYGSSPLRKQLVADKAPAVRASIADSGGEHDILKNDSHQSVRAMVRRYNNMEPRTYMQHWDKLHTDSKGL